MSNQNSMFSPDMNNDGREMLVQREGEIFAYAAATISSPDHPHHCEDTTFGNVYTATSGEVCGYFGIADGVGGQSMGYGGEASAIAAKSTELYLNNLKAQPTLSDGKKLIYTVVKDAESKISEKRHEKGRSLIGTTFVIGLACKDPDTNKQKMLFYNRGDSVVFRLRKSDNSLIQCTADQSKVAIKAGVLESTTLEDAFYDKARNIIEYSLFGSSSDLTEFARDFSESDMDEGDIFFAVSDGITDNITYTNKDGNGKRKAVFQACVNSAVDSGGNIDAQKLSSLIVNRAALFASQIKVKMDEWVKGGCVGLSPYYALQQWIQDGRPGKNPVYSEISGNPKEDDYGASVFIVRETAHGKVANMPTELLANPLDINGNEQHNDSLQIEKDRIIYAQLQARRARNNLAKASILRYSLIIPDIISLSENDRNNYEQLYSDGKITEDDELLLLQQIPWQKIGRTNLTLLEITEMKKEPLYAVIIAKVLSIEQNELYADQNPRKASLIAILSFLEDGTFTRFNDKTIHNKAQYEILYNNIFSNPNFGPLWYATKRNELISRLNSLPQNDSAIQERVNSYLNNFDIFGDLVFGDAYRYARAQEEQKLVIQVELQMKANQKINHGPRARAPVQVSAALLSDSMRPQEGVRRYGAVKDPYVAVAIHASQAYSYLVSSKDYNNARTDLRKALLEQDPQKLYVRQEYLIQFLKERNNQEVNNDRDIINLYPSLLDKETDKKVPMQIWEKIERPDKKELHANRLKDVLSYMLSHADPPHFENMQLLTPAKLGLELNEDGRYEHTYQFFEMRARFMLYLNELVQSGKMTTENKQALNEACNALGDILYGHSKIQLTKAFEKISLAAMTNLYENTVIDL